MSKLYLNEDCNHFVVSRALSGIRVDRNEIESFINQYRDSGVTDFLFNINGSIAWAPSEVRETAVQKYREILDAGKLDEIDSFSAKYVGTQYDVYCTQGIDMHREWGRLLQQNGIRPWVSFRTNDIHNNDDDKHFLHSSFFVGKKHLRRASHHPSTDYYDNALDFTCAEVRDHLFEYIEESLNSFDVYGFELDWMREIYSVRIGREAEGLQILTDYMARIREAALKAEKKWGHPIKLAVRMPANPTTCMRFGFDIIEWINRELFDVLIVTPRWATTDNDMPIDLWKRILRKKNIELAAGLEILIDPYFMEPNKHFMYQSPETARGTACAYLSMGADSIYLFNFMDALGYTDPKIRGSAIDPAIYLQTLSELGDLDTLVHKPRRHVVTYCDVHAPGAANPSQLPLRCEKRNGRIAYKTLRIPTGKVLPDARVSLVLGFDKGLSLDENDLDIYVNAHKAAFCGETSLPQPASPGLRYQRWSVPAQALQNGVGIVEIGAPRSPVIVRWAEIDVNMNEKS